MARKTTSDTAPEETIAAPELTPEVAPVAATEETGAAAEVAGPPTLLQTIQTHLDEIRAQLQRDDTRRALAAVDQLIALVATQQHA